MYCKMHSGLLRQFKVGWIVQHGVFRHLNVRNIVHGSPIYHRVEGSLLYHNPLSVNSTKFHFSTILFTSFQTLIGWNFRSFIRKNLKLENIIFHFMNTRLNAIMGIQIVGSIGYKSYVARMSLSWYANT